MGVAENSQGSCTSRLQGKAEANLRNTQWGESRPFRIVYQTHLAALEDKMDEEVPLP